MSSSGHSLSGYGLHEVERATNEEVERLRAEVEKLRSAKEAAEHRLDWSLRRLARNTKSLAMPRKVERRRIDSLSAIEFARDYVANSTPVVFTDLEVADWPCLHRWSDDYLMKVAGESQVSVNVTADGLGDFVNDKGQFVKPLEERMKFADFWKWLHRRGVEEKDFGIPYLSRQNDSLREELPVLAGDVPPVVPLGSAVFGNDPEAVNLWIGDGRATSSCHKDHYENLYVVVRGEKVFTLLPPLVAPFLHEQRCSAAHFERVGGALQIVEDDELAEVPWVPIDVASPDRKRYADFKPNLSLEVHLYPGEMLYLPSMWYHQVTQVGVTIAVNYWHDMQYGHAYVHHQFIRDTAGLNDHEPDIVSESEEET